MEELKLFVYEVLWGPHDEPPELAVFSMPHRKVTVAAGSPEAAIAKARAFLVRTEVFHADHVAPIHTCKVICAVDVP
jgi:hypothetical protein